MALRFISVRRLWVKSGSMEVVYCAALARWARQFLCAPWGAAARALLAYHSVRDSTKARLLTHWEEMMRAGPVGTCCTRALPAHCASAPLPRH